MARHKAQVVIRRTTAVRVGIVAVVLAALGLGFAIGLAMSSSQPPANMVVVDASIASTTSPTPAATAIPVAVPADKSPTVLPCGAGATQRVRPTVIDIGCATRNVSITTITWSSWDSRTGSGSGTLHKNNCQPSCAAGGVYSSPAFVVVSNPVGGVFQDVVITPPSGIVTPQSSSQPGSGWGSG